MSRCLCWRLVFFFPDTLLVVSADSFEQSGANNKENHKNTMEMPPTVDTKDEREENAPHPPRLYFFLPSFKKKQTWLAVLCCGQLDKFHVQTVSQMFGTGSVFWRGISSKNVSLMQNDSKNGCFGHKVVRIWRSALSQIILHRDLNNES